MFSFSFTSIFDSDVVVHVEPGRPQHFGYCRQVRIDAYSDLQSLKGVRGWNACSHTVIVGRLPGFLTLYRA